MNRVCVSLFCALVAFSAVSLLTADRAAALPAFKKPWEDKYVKKGENKDWEESVKKAGCNVCHNKDKMSKKERNDYGKKLAEKIEGDAKKRLDDAGDAGKAAETEKLLKELSKAMDEVAKMKVNEKDEKSPTWAEYFKSGKLPETTPEKK